MITMHPSMFLQLFLLAHTRSLSQPLLFLMVLLTSPSCVSY